MLNDRIERRLQALLPWHGTHEDLLEHFTDWYYFENVEVTACEMMCIEEFLYDLDYFTKNKIKRINRYVYEYAKLILSRKVEVEVTGDK